MTKKQLFSSLIAISLSITSSLITAKQTDIGIAAIAANTTLVGKGKFAINDMLDEGDSLKTGEKGAVTILFNDESMLTLGADAHVSVEVYQEAQNGQPGRSVIRVHKGQFRYFPGSILENGGSQFVAVGDRLIGKSAAPKQRLIANHTNNRNENISDKQTNSTQRKNTDRNNDDSKGRPQIIASTDGSSDGGATGGVTGGIQGPPTSTNRTRRPDQSAMTNQATDGSQDTGTDEPDGGGGISGLVGAGTLLADPSPAADGSDGSSSSGGSGTPIPSDSDAAEVAAADTETSSESSSDSDNSDSDSDSDSGGSVVRNDIAFEVAIGGRGGAAGTGGNGGTDQDCGGDTCNGNGSGIFPGGTGLGAPEVIGGSRGGSIGNPPRIGGIDGFIENGISGSVIAGAGQFSGSADVFAGIGKQTDLLGSVSAGKYFGFTFDGRVAADISGSTLKGIAPSGNISKNISTNLNRDIGTNISRNIGADISRNIGADISRNIGAEISRNIGADISRNIGADISRTIGADVTRSIVVETPRTVDTTTFSQGVFTGFQGNIPAQF